jgi:hypothetical protein
MRSKCFLSGFGEIFGSNAALLIYFPNIMHTIAAEFLTGSFFDALLCSIPVRTESILAKQGKGAI